MPSQSRRIRLRNRISCTNMSEWVLSMHPDINHIGYRPRSEPSTQSTVCGASEVSQPLWAVAAAAAGAESQNTRQVTTLCMQVIWSDRLCVCVRLMTVSHTQRAGSTGLTHPVPVRDHNVLNTVCDLYVVRVDIPATSHAQAPRTP